MEQNQELSVSITTRGKCGEDEEQLTGENCPVCGYPIVLEMGLEVCYNCGWSKEDINELDI